MEKPAQHIHIGIEPDIKLYHKLCCMQKATHRLKVSKKEREERCEELDLLCILANRPRFDDKGLCPNVCRELTELPYRYYPEYTFEIPSDCSVQ